MNKLIENLFARALDEAVPETWTRLDMVQVPWLCDKFAELIVRECGYYADVFDALGCPVDMDPTETKPSDYIKKHFGVK